MTNPRLHLTKSLVDAEPLTTEGQRIVWDTEVKGFGLLVGKRTKSFFLQRDLRGKSRRYNLGRTAEPGGVTLQEARKAALDLIAQFNRGIDPKEQERAEQERERAQQEEAKREAERAVTLRQAWQAYQQRELSPKTRQGYESITRLYLTPWMDRPLRDITRSEVRSWYYALQKDIAAGKYAQRVGKKRKPRRDREGEAAGHEIASRWRTGKSSANDAFKVLRAIYNDALAEHPELPPNPTDVLKGKGKRFSTAKPRSAIPKDTLRAWWAGVAQIPNPVRRDYLRFVLLTGLRRQSAAEMRWAHIDFRHKTLLIPRPKGGEAKAFTLPLSSYLVDLLQKRRDENPGLVELGVIPDAESWVFPAFSESGHIEEPREEIAGVPYSIHDLRRTFLTVAESLDISQYSIKALVNHSQPRGDVTAGYINLDVERLRAPMQRVTDYILGVAGEDSSEVAALPARMQQTK